MCISYIFYNDPIFFIEIHDILSFCDELAVMEFSVGLAVKADGLLTCAGGGFYLYIVCGESLWDRQHHRLFA